MSEWSKTLTVIVPESLIPQGNLLAFSVGTSEDDINTFQQASWTDGTSNYAIAHTTAVAQILDYFGALTPEEYPDLTDALSLTIFPTLSTDDQGITTINSSDMSMIQVFVDVEPFSLFNLLGLTRNEAA